MRLLMLVKLALIRKKKTKKLALIREKKLALHHRFFSRALGHAVALHHRCWTYNHLRRHA
jgi:hypothetical protein